MNIENKKLKIRTSLCMYANKIIFYSFSILLFLLCVSNIFYTIYTKDYSEVPLYKQTNIILIMIAILFLISVFFLYKYKLINKLQTPMILKCLLVYTFFVSVCWVYMSHHLPVADQKMVYNIAKDFYNGDFSAFNQPNYLFIYMQQLGLTAFLELLYTVFGNQAYKFFELLNVFALCMIFYMLYKIANEVFKDKMVNKLLLLILFGCLPPIFYCVFVYGELISLVFCLIAIFFELKYFETTKIKFLLLTTLSISFAIIIRTNCYIFLIAMVIVCIIKIINNGQLKNLILLSLIIIIPMFSNFALKEIYEYRSGIEIGKGFPMILHVGMGLRESDVLYAPGWFSGYTCDTFRNNDYDYEMASEQAKQDIKDSTINFIKNPQYAFKFFTKKFISQWNDATYQCLIINRSHEPDVSVVTNSVFYGKLNKIILPFMKIYQLIILFGSLCYVIFNFKKINTEKLFLALVILGGFVFHMIWEAKGRYILPYFIILIPYAAVGIHSLVMWFNRKNLSPRVEK